MNIAAIIASQTAMRQATLVANQKAKRDRKRKEWCNQCHNKHDCKDKERFLNSGESTCTEYA